METKFCSRGKHDVDVVLFSKSSKTKDGLFAWCKPCMAEYERERYQNGDRERKERNRSALKERGQSYIWSVLNSSSCLDCGNDDPLVLEFDHRSDKEFHISEMPGRHSIARIKAEVAKCDVRCANCHKKKTAREFGFWRSLK
jgi:hypothetical protein